MYLLKRPRRRSEILLLLLLTLLLSACAAQLGGDNWPGVSVDGDRVYVAYGNYVVSVDVVAQEEVWSFPIEPSGVLYMAAPEVADGQIIISDFGASQGLLTPGVLANVYALPADQTGRLSESDLKWTSQVPVAEDRIVAPARQGNGLVYVGTADNDLVALEAESGREIWREPVGHSIWGQPAYVDGIVVATSLDRGVYAFDGETGEQLWRMEQGGAIASSPIIVGDVVLVSGFDAQLHAYDLTEGTELWTAQADDWIWNSPAVDGNRAFFGDEIGNVFAISLDDGSELWTYQATGRIEAGLVADDGVVVVASLLGNQQDGQTSEVVGISAENGTQIWRLDSIDPIFITPVIADGRLVLATQPDDIPIQLTVHDLQSSTQQWRYTPSTE